MTSKPKYIYGVPLATLNRIAKRAYFFRVLLIRLGVNSPAMARALRVSSGTTRAWREMAEAIPPDIYRVLNEAYGDCTWYYEGDPDWIVFRGALRRRARAARLPGF